MKHNYDALLILDIQGKEEGVKEALDEIKSSVESVGGSVRSTQRMDRRKFERAPGKIDSGYYLGVNFELEPTQLNSLKKAFNLNEKIYRQFYLRVEKPKAVATD
jgi:small subunit ribosomal protein S6